MKELSLQVKSNDMAPGISRSHLAPVREALEPRYDDVVLLVSELVTNSVRHSATRGIDVTVRSYHTQVRIEVTDDGPGFAADDPRGDGMGLAIVDKLAERWGMTDGKRFTVWAELAK